VANALGKTKLETDINNEGVVVLERYVAAWGRCAAKDKEQQLAGTVEGTVEAGEGLPCMLPCPLPSVPSDVDALLPVLQALVAAEARDKSKHVDLLLVSCVIARLLKGARTTSCKSAKDRTSVFHTLEVAHLAMRSGLLAPPSSLAIASHHFYGHHGLVDHHELRRRSVHLANALRGPQGVRLANCQLNVGRAKYAFNALQLQALPQELRPPPSTASGGAS
jgi:hypothetical protein